MALVVATLLLNWIMICLALCVFVQRCDVRGVKHSLRRCLSVRQLSLHRLPRHDFAADVTMDDMRLSAILLPVWIVFLLWHLKRCVGNKAFTLHPTKRVRSHPFDESGFFNYCLNAPAESEYHCRLATDEVADQTLRYRKYVIEYISLNAFIFQPHHVLVNA